MPTWTNRRGQKSFERYVFLYPLPWCNNDAGKSDESSGTFRGGFWETAGWMGELPRNLITFFRRTRNYRSSPPPDVFNLLCRRYPDSLPPPLGRQIRWSLMAKHGAGNSQGWRKRGGGDWLTNPKPIFIWKTALNSSCLSDYHIPWEHFAVLG